MKAVLALTRAAVLALALGGCSGAGTGTLAGPGVGAGEDKAAGGPVRSSQARAGVRLLRVGTFRQPTYLTSPPGDRRRRFVTERGGRIRVVLGGRKLRAPFLDITRRVGTEGEGGLLSMAFASDYRRSRLLYVYYVDRSGALRVDRYRRSARNPNRARRGSRRAVIRQPHSRGNHKGGQIQFGADGMLYIGFGDGGGANDPDDNAQNLRTRLGKLLRIDPKPGGGYRVPKDNPFVRRAGARREIFAYGLRNPYRFSFDRRTGDLTLADVGQDAVEEVDFLKASRRARRPRGGVDFGWDGFEGRRSNPSGSSPRRAGHTPPVLQRTHAQGACSITGGYVIRDRSLGRLYGAYVYGDLCDPRLRVARLRPGRARGDRALGPRVPTLVSFGEDARGRVHAVSLDGGVFRLARRR
ncbi:MAG: PQQ-dependent sugar dehydrogenase [Thermoleophilaceae bacterium]